MMVPARITLTWLLGASLLRTALGGAVVQAGDWITEPSFYTHGPNGERVQQYTPIGPYYVYVDPTYQRSGYRHTRSTLQGPFGSDNYHVVEEWGRPVRPYDEWRFPYRPYSVPYDQWGPPYAGLGAPWLGGGPYGPWGNGPWFPGAAVPGGVGPGGVGPGGVGPGWGPGFPGGGNGVPPVPPNPPGVPNGGWGVPYPGYQPWFDDRYPAFDDRSPWRRPGAF